MYIYTCLAGWCIQLLFLSPFPENRMNGKVKNSPIWTTEGPFRRIFFHRMFPFTPGKVSALWGGIVHGAHSFKLCRKIPSAPPQDAWTEILWVKVGRPSNRRFYPIRATVVAWLGCPWGMISGAKLAVRITLYPLRSAIRGLFVSDCEL